MSKKPLIRKYWKDRQITFNLNYTLHKELDIHYGWCLFTGAQIDYISEKEHFCIKAMYEVRHFMRDNMGLDIW